ncbi:MAG TPA: hypothetical protein DEH78_05235 [Solibacterales bacterium]|nr:hypothetical protein [Bryobacterales bacterium]
MPAPLAKRFGAVRLAAMQDSVRASLRRAYACCGGQTTFRRLLSARMLASGETPPSKQTLSAWIDYGRFIDRRYWSHFEDLTECEVTRRDLRPDLFASPSDFESRAAIVPLRRRSTVATIRPLSGVVERLGPGAERRQDAAPCARAHVRDAGDHEHSGAEPANPGAAAAASSLLR